MLSTITTVTNAVVMCFELVTTEVAQIPCPDGIEGCRSAHFAKRVRKSYVPCLHNVDTNEVAATEGFAFKPAVRQGMKDIYEKYRFHHPIVAITVADEDGKVKFNNGRPVVIGWVSSDKLMDSLKVEKKDALPPCEPVK